MGVGPYQPGDTARIPLEITVNGIPRDVLNPRVNRLVMPDQSNAPGFPKSMTRISEGTYILEIPVQQIGNYTAIIQAEFTDECLNDGDPFTIEEIESFVVETGFFKIEAACGDS